MRRAAKVDANQSAIVRSLRQAGASVLSLAAMGHGCPDLLVGFLGDNYLLEVKDPMQPPSKQKLTPDEELFKGTWVGQYAVIRTVDEALAVLVKTTGGAERVRLLEAENLRLSTIAGGRCGSCHTDFDALTKAQMELAAVRERDRALGKALDVLSRSQCSWTMADYQCVLQDGHVGDHEIRHDRTCRKGKP